MESKTSTGLVRTKFRRNEKLKKFYEPIDWDWNLPQRPYLELPDEKLCYEATWREKRREEHNEYSNKPESVLQSAINLIKVRTKITKNEIFRIGELLCCVVKPLCKQLGRSYEECIRKNFDFSPETAKNFINVYEQCMGIRDIAIHLQTTVLYKISRPNFPEELRDWLLAQNNLEEITFNQVDKLFQKYRTGNFKFEVIEGDINEINRQYRVFVNGK